MTWKRITSVGELKPGQRFRAFRGGDSFEAASERIGGDDSPRYLSATTDNPASGERDAETVAHFFGWHHTVEALVADDEPAVLAEIWNKVSLAICEAVLKTPTGVLSDEKWSEIEFCMRKIERIAADLRASKSQAKA